jgi:hypothetical protein
MGSLFHELVRRKVLRSAALYLAATWLILQVADIVLDAFEAPPAIMRVLIVAFTAGFPLFLLLSWFYEFRGARLVKDTGVSAETSRPWTSRSTNVTIAVLIILGAWPVPKSRSLSCPSPVSALTPPTSTWQTG